MNQALGVLLLLGLAASGLFVLPVSDHQQGTAVATANQPSLQTHSLVSAIAAVDTVGAGQNDLQAVDDFRHLPGSGITLGAPSKDGEFPPTELRPLRQQETRLALAMKEGEQSSPQEPFDENRLPRPSAAAQKCIAKLHAIKTATGHAPSLEDFRNLLQQPEVRLSRADYDFIHADFSFSQKPDLSLDEIRVLHASLRNSISTFHASWVTENTWNVPVDPVVANGRVGRFEFWMDGNKLRYDAQRGPTAEQLPYMRSRSYSDGAERVFETDGMVRTANIHPMVSVSYYFKRHHPFWISKLVDTQRDLGQANSDSENFQNRYAAPLEMPVEFNGVSCLALLEQDTVYFLDPKKNYAYCGMETGRFVFNERDGKMVESDSYATDELSEFQDYGNGVWFPKRAVETRYKKGAVECMLTINLTLAEINRPIEKTVFEHIFPAGIEVLDGIRNVIYRERRNKPIGDQRE